MDQERNTGDFTSTEGAEQITGESADLGAGEVMVCEFALTAIGKSWV
ncbi:MAG: hypothetical protein AB1426_05400 [Bacillota bacterium]